jgi:transcription antitermination factor NusG
LRPLSRKKGTGIFKGEVKVSLSPFMLFRGEVKMVNPVRKGLSNGVKVKRI